MRTRVWHEGGFGRRSAPHDELRSLAISLGQLLLPGDRYGNEWTTTPAFSALTAVLCAPQVSCSWCSCSDQSGVWPTRPSSCALSVGTLMYTAEAEPIVTCIIDEAILELLQVAFFVKKEALETLHAESRLVPLARRRTPPRWAAARSTCWAVRSCARFRNLSKLVGHSGGSQVGCARVPGTTSRMCDIRVE